MIEGEGDSMFGLEYATELFRMVSRNAMFFAVFLSFAGSGSEFFWNDVFVARLLGGL